MDKLKTFFAATIYEGHYKNFQHWANIMSVISIKQFGQNEYIAGNATSAQRYFEIGRDNYRALSKIYSLESNLLERLSEYWYLLKNRYKEPAFSCFRAFHPLKDGLLGALGCYLVYHKIKSLLRANKDYRGRN